MKLSLIWKKKKEIKPELNWRREKKTCLKLSEYPALRSSCGCVGFFCLNLEISYGCLEMHGEVPVRLCMNLTSALASVKARGAYSAFRV